MHFLTKMSGSCSSIYLPYFRSTLCIVRYSYVHNFFPYIFGLRALYSQVLHILKLNIIHDNSSGKVLPAGQAYSIFKLLILCLQSKIYSFYYYYFSNSSGSVSYFLEEGRKIHQYNVKMLNLYFCLTIISNEKRKNTIIQLPPFTFLSLLYYSLCYLIVFNGSLLFPSCLSHPLTLLS